MSSQQLDEERIFHLAREIPKAEARSEYLDQVCAGDIALRERVEALLEVHENEQAFLKSDPDAAPTVDHTPLTEHPGTTIGRYKLMEQIGEGGMGTVFVAEQERPIRRKVALKVIKPGMDSKAVVARFEAERQALALMDHPNIAKVLDAGTTDSGRPYFVMELVRGIPITEYCDQHKLTIRERLELFTQVCQAIQHAHQKAIIHRDIKPTNVLVTEQDGNAVPKVIDFGVAKALNQRLTERTIYTTFAQVVGTPLYMSPEQAALSAVDVDTRSDVYSLGVLLYELLTGTAPFDRQRFEQAAYDEIRRIVREEEPPKPSTKISTLGDRGVTVAHNRRTDHEKLGRSVRGDLDWIVMKALEKDRNRRYESPSNFALDIRSYLANEPVGARPPTLQYRVSKYLKRNRLAVSITVLVVAALSIGLAGTAWQARVAQVALARIETQKQSLLSDAMTQTTIFALQGDLATAREKLKSARVLGADAGWCKLREGQIALQDGEYDKARALLHEAQTMLPKSTVAHSLSIICDNFAGYEHAYLLKVGDLKNWPASEFEDYLFRGLAQTWANPHRAVQDLELALSENANNAVVHLLLASALRLLATDTTDARESYVTARRAVGEAFIAKEMLKENALAIAEYIHAHIVLANACKELGPEYRHEQDETISLVRSAVEDSKSFKDYDPMVHRARWYFYNQFGARQDEASELFSNVPENLGKIEGHSDVVFRRSWMRFRENDLESARREFDSMEGSFSHRTNLTFPALIDMTAVSNKEGLGILQKKYRALLSDSERDKQGIFAHHDWAIARLLRLDDVAKQKGEYFHELAITLHHDFTDEFEPLAKYMRGDSVPPEVGLQQGVNSNRFLAETFFLLGVDRLGDGDRGQARQYFEKCLETRYYTFFVYWWSQAFIERVDDKQWLPWLNAE